MTQEHLTVDEVQAMAKPKKRHKRDQAHRDEVRPIYIPINAHVTRDGDVIRLVLPPPVSANSYWRSRVVQADGQKPMSVTYLSAAAKAYKAIVKKIGQCCNPLRGPVKVTATVFRPRRSGDLDNTIKVTLDSIQGVALNEDSQVRECHWYQDLDPGNPRIEVEIVSLGKVEGLLFGDLAEPAKKRRRKAK